MAHTWHIIPIVYDDGAERIAIVDAPREWRTWLSSNTDYIPAEAVVFTLLGDQWREAHAMCEWRNGTREFAQWLEWSEAA